MSWYDSHATPCSLVICRLVMTGWVNEKRCGVALFNFMEPSMTGRWASPSRQGFARLSLQNQLSPLGRPHRPERKIKVSVLSSFENHFNVSSFEILVTPPNWFVSTNTVSIGHGEVIGECCQNGGFLSLCLQKLSNMFSENTVLHHSSEFLAIWFRRLLLVEVLVQALRQLYTFFRSVFNPIQLEMESRSSTQRISNIMGFPRQKSSRSQRLSNSRRSVGTRDSICWQPGRSR